MNNQPVKPLSAHLAQALWSAFGVIATLMLATSGYPIHAFGAVFVAVFSVIWIEYTVREQDQSKVWVSFAVIMAWLAIWNHDIKNRDDSW